MSVITTYVRLRPDELAELRGLLVESPAEALEYADDLRMDDRGMDSGKAWDGLRHLLAKLAPPVDVISGGEPLTAGAWSADAPRLLTAEQVTAAAHFLSGTPFTSLARHYDPAELTLANVYPEAIWDEDWALEYLEDSYGNLVALFQAAAAGNEPIILWKS
ncbi:hypothetical protein ACTI_54560 [Actinoplanes sp. OR16]|uniref:YfbM family protein n=1 Tax=Actinoplanes sp. OR16 TaxID=946334 RepID=UPI000F702651|nr:YfbM family protein [Actinoplanes sp. OR16]BBH68771.1 hypothetical protein ACTI_54560 [Actinoplanes sp. OR16]